jgi:hypothetical protein
MRLEMAGVQKIQIRKENTPFLRTRTHAEQNSFQFQNSQNSRLTVVGEQSASLPMKGEEK